MGDLRRGALPAIEAMGDAGVRSALRGYMAGLPALSDPEQVDKLVRAQSPLLGTAMMGLPGLSVPTGLVDGLPVGVQLVSGRFREDRCLGADELVERAASFSALEALDGVSG